MSELRRALILFAAFAALSGCTGMGSGTGGSFETMPSSDTGAIISEVGNPRDRAKAHTDLGAAYYERGSMGVAIEEMRIALKADPNYAPAYNVLGLVHMDLRENAQAQTAFERSLQINPNDPDTNHNFAWFLCQTGREDQSIRHFMAAIGNPLYATPQKSYALAGECALRKGNERDAVEYFGRALRLDPGNLSALINLAQFKYRRGELEEARVLVGRYNKVADPTAESLWLALRIERKLGDRVAENSYASQLRQRFAGSREDQERQKGRFE